MKYLITEAKNIYLNSQIYNQYVVNAPNLHHAKIIAEEQKIMAISEIGIYEYNEENMPLAYFQANEWVYSRDDFFKC